MKFIIRIHWGEQVPWSHRVAWHDPIHRSLVCAPIGLHWILSLVHRTWIATYVWRPDAWSRKCFNIEQRSEKRHAERFRRLQQRNEVLLRACITAQGAYEALKLTGADKYLPGYDSCLADLKAAITQAKEMKPNESRTDSSTHPTHG